MKRTFASGLKTLIALFVLLAGLFLANTAGAQALNGQQSSNNWLPAAEVVQIAKTQVEFWHQQGPYSPGTTNYYNQMRHAAYFKAIFTSVEAGTPVGTAVVQSLSEAATVAGEKEAAFTSKTVLNAIKVEATELFSN